MIMKTYIKPNTDVTKVIFEGNLLAGTVNWENENTGTATVNEGTGNGTILGKENGITSNSLWDEEE